MKIDKLKTMVKSKFLLLIQRSQRSSKKEKLIASCVSILIVLIALFYIFINPKFVELRSAGIALDRAKSGYNFILQNASKVNSTPVQVIDNSMSVQKSAILAAKENGIQGAVIKEIDARHASVEIEDAKSYAKINQMLRTLENKYGVTVDEITLDKQGDAVVYIANLQLIRLDKDEEDDGQ
jgi:type II secretory pathway component PulM